MDNTGAIRTVVNSPSDTSDIAPAPLGAQSGVHTNTDAVLAPPLSEYAEMKGYPYTAEHFALQIYWDDDVFPEIHDKIRGIEEFVQRKIYELGLENTVESYREVINKIVDQIGTYENEKPEALFNRISAATQAISRLENAKIEPVFDATTLDPHEYEEIMYYGE